MKHLLTTLALIAALTDTAFAENLNLGTISVPNASVIDARIDAAVAAYNAQHGTSIARRAWLRRTVRAAVRDQLQSSAAVAAHAEVEALKATKRAEIKQARDDANAGWQ